MKNNLLSCLLLFISAILSVAHGQSTLNGFKYQAVVRDESSQQVKNKKLDVRVSIKGSNPEKEPFYTELHQAITNQDGLFELVIGHGQQKNGLLDQLPWAEEQMWLHLESIESGSQYTLISSSPIMAVPYALHAMSTAAIYDPNIFDTSLEKTGAQSIYWTTSGNSGTNPNVHFIGTKDNNPLVFKVNNRPYMTLTTNGRLELTSDIPAGVDSDKKFYPVVVQGSTNTQGVWVHVNANRSKVNNFVSFVDNQSKIKGRIEGQTLSDLEQSDSYLTAVKVTSINSVALVSKLVELAAKIVAESASVALAAIVCGITLGIVACPDIAALTAGAIASVVKLKAWTVELATYAIATGTSFGRIRRDVGVAYATGSGDYAEWLIRNTTEKDMVFGEVIGVNGGVVTRNTATAGHVMVVSQFPAFLGKTPVEGTEDQYEKVAFMGQVPVRIIGNVHSGDYIIPSGKNDGFGIAIDPLELPTADYNKIVGVAWETIENNFPFNMVNVAVGIEPNQLAGKVHEVEQKVDKIVRYLDGPSQPTNTIAEQAQVSNESLHNVMSEEKFNRIIDMGSRLIVREFAKVEKELRAEGQDVVFNNPALARLFKDPVNTLKEMYHDPNAYAEKILAAAR